MNTAFLYFLVLVFLSIIGLGIYLTVISRKDDTDKSNPKWVTDHLKTIKWAAPTTIGIGSLFLIWTLYTLYEHTGELPPHSKFGFKFY